MGSFIFITGGVRSGKSRFAQELAAKSGEDVLFVATAEALDDEMHSRITNHRQARPAHWRTLEVATDIDIPIRENTGNAQVVIIDCITLLTGNIFTRGCSGEKLDVPLIEKKLDGEISGLLSCIKDIQAVFIVVSNEVGLGVVPDNQMARLYRDLLGKANQRLANQADEVYLMVAGLPLRIK